VSVYLPEMPWMYFNNATASGEGLGVTGLMELHPPHNKPSNGTRMVRLFMSASAVRFNYCMV
jgi:hypothetical protein